MGNTGTFTAMHARSTWRYHGDLRANFPARQYLQNLELPAMIYTATCHCKAVQIEMDTQPPLNAIRCNCSMCQKSGLLHLVVPASKFRLVKGESQLECYTFNSHIAKHYFCKICGIRPFYIPRSNPDGYSVNARCLDPYPTDITIEDFDGQNWEKYAAGIAHLSKDQDSP